MTGPGAERLSAASVSRARAAGPTYDRVGPAPIVHLGVGAFARAHLGVYADDLLRAGWPAMIRGVSLRNHRAEDQLAPQDGLYTLLEREPGPERPLRVLGSLASVATGRAAAVAAIGSAATTLVTLTVTEKGYAPDSAPAVVGEGLARRDRTAPAPVVASLDNVLDNGGLLRRRVLEVADRTDPTLARWIADAVRFPDSVVDRMVPATTAADLDEVEQRLGLRDEAAVVAEHHCSWAITVVDGLPPLGDVGVQVVADVGPFQRRKLWLLNGPHSALAYAGLLSGCDTIAAASRHPLVRSFVDRLIEDVLPVADLPSDLDGRAYAADALHRFGNDALGHTCRQVGADGSQKLLQRVLPVVTARRQKGLPTERFAVVVAVWLAAATALPLGGVTLPTVEDPVAEDLCRIAAGGDLRALSAAGLGATADGAFADEVAGTLGRLMRVRGRRVAGGPMTATLGGADGVVADDAVIAFVDEQFAALDLDGRSLCLVIPDATRQCPLPLLLGAIGRAVARPGPVVPGGRGPGYPRPDDGTRRCGRWWAPTRSPS